MGKLHAVKCDVTLEEDVKRSFAWIEDNLGPPAVLINNAGVFKRNSIADANLDEIKTIFNTNVIGLITCTKEVLNSMTKNQTEGTIININSILGHSVMPFTTHLPYIASKFAVTALTEGIRNEVTQLGANVRVTSLSPGAVDTEMTSDAMLPYDMLPASKIADCVLFVLRSPQTMNISELTVQSRHETSLHFAELLGRSAQKTT